ncbi:MAG: helicase [Magnetococcales bacterium]|nr:helicase [Magnetococcales bacterium]NGZ26673.1 helicase [Magnetococcales bacterium]
MKLIKNRGNDRVLDELRRALVPSVNLDIATPSCSLFAFAELRELLDKVKSCRIILASNKDQELGWLGSTGDRSFRNRLTIRYLARQCAAWITKKAEVRIAPTLLPQSAIMIYHPDPHQHRVITGHCPFTTDGLGMTPGNQFSLIQCADTAEEVAALGSWFGHLWNSTSDDKARVLDRLQSLASHKAPSLVYFQILHNVFKNSGESLDEEQIIKSATGIRNTIVWNKLFRFQRDGVFGAIDKLERYGGCIIADSVGLGKTFEALAVIKYYELRNDRVLVLCPKRLRDNWTLYKANDRRNFLAADRFHYDVLNHTDISRDGGFSGDMDLSHVNWGNYDLVVIDESHNFRNKPSHVERESRYGRLMSRIIRAGVKSRVLMLSATPVNNRLADLKNQLAFITEGNDTVFGEHGILSIEHTTRVAQFQFNQWLGLPNETRKPESLTEMLGFDYFKLLDMLTIARSRKHLVKYYGITETGRFPERLKPRNFHPDVDLQGDFPPARIINDEIRRLNLAAYTPLRYVLPDKRAAYDARYDTQVQGGKSRFRQVDREENMSHLIRVNLLKRMESSVDSFSHTLERQLAQIKILQDKLKTYKKNGKAQVEAVSIQEIDLDDPHFETLLVGDTVKVLLQDVDAPRWIQELEEDRLKVARMFHAARRVTAATDAKLATLKTLIREKVEQPINGGNRKMIIFTAFADTAEYLYGALADWAKQELSLESAMITGSGKNRSTLSAIGGDMGRILAAFSPRSKECPPDLLRDGELDLLIATDCISEGQNLQDCDCLVNYDIHWNPVRIIQRFGRIDRIGSTNEKIQLVNFWPNLELEEYINLEQRVSGRMVLLDVSATGEENVIESLPADRMNDLEYRRKQMTQLMETVIDMEDVDGGISITDLTLNDFRMDLAGLRSSISQDPDQLPLGSFAVTTTMGSGEAAIAPGVIFCLRAASEAALAHVEPGYPLAPHYLVHVGESGAILLPFTLAKQILDRMRKLAMGQDQPDAAACARFDQTTRDGRDMTSVQKLLAKAVAAISGKKEERAMASLFTPGGTHAMKGEFAGMDDFEVVAYLVILP